MHLLSKAAFVAPSSRFDPRDRRVALRRPGQRGCRHGRELLAWSLKVAAVVLGAVVLNRLVRWLLRRLVRGLEHRYIQQPLESPGPRHHVPCSLPPIRCPACAARNGPR